MNIFNDNLNKLSNNFELIIQDKEIIDPQKLAVDLQFIEDVISISIRDKTFLSNPGIFFKNYLKIFSQLHQIKKITSTDSINKIQLIVLYQLINLEKTYLVNREINLNLNSIIKNNKEKVINNYTVSNCNTTFNVFIGNYHLANTQVEETNKNLKNWKLDGCTAADSSLYFSLAFEKFGEIYPIQNKIKEALAFYVDVCQLVFTHIKDEKQMQEDNNSENNDYNYYINIGEIVNTLHANNCNFFTEIYDDNKQYLFTDVNTLPSAAIFHKLIKQVFQKVVELKNEEWMWLPLCTFDHHMVLEIEKNAQNWVFRIFNAGYGSKVYHIKKEDKIFPFIIKDITFSQLSLSFFEKIFWDICSSKIIADPYAFISNYFPANEKTKNYIDSNCESFLSSSYISQKYEICSFESIEIALSSRLSTEEKIKFKKFVLDYAYDKQKELIKKQKTKIEFYQNAEVLIKIPKKQLTPIKNIKAEKDNLKKYKILLQDIKVRKKLLK